MVYYYTSNVVLPPAFIYVGKDKVENEELIKYGLEKDVWYYTMSRLLLPPFSYPSGFHVDNLSSAHVYLRLRDGETWDNIPEDILEDCAQLTKANSIEGNKKDNITVIYTPWSNLKKSAGMATGQVSFHNPKLVKKVFIPVRLNPVVNRLNKTKEEKYPDLREEKDEYMKKLGREERKLREERKAAEKREKKEREELRWQKEHAYDDLLNEENVLQSSNQDRDADFLDDFM
ncbi:hypothetical protein AJ80_08319 [Polytolypa hystricis UAMH7299]|uniref:NFACT RNA-binding domain-containing protein n=1 Tax=Polytolypa hystricis (strain UAMH7299) TaxID=1447883 RepID=A0A2B7XA97_POLH7|nr:hypothetical protein AJ80_08319 [Polytolypa hystricis UAMH7299]